MTISLEVLKTGRPFLIIFCVSLDTDDGAKAANMFVLKQLHQLLQTLSPIRLSLCTRRIEKAQERERKRRSSAIPYETLRGITWLKVDSSIPTLNEEADKG